MPSGNESYELMTKPRINIQGAYAAANKTVLRTTLLTFTSKVRISPCKARLVKYEGRSRSKISYFFSRGMEADRNVKVVGGDVAVL